MISRATFYNFIFIFTSQIELDYSGEDRLMGNGVQDVSPRASWRTGLTESVS